MTVSVKPAPNSKRNLEQQKLQHLRWTCFLSKEEDLSADPRVARAAQVLLRFIIDNLPSDQFSAQHIKKMGEIDIEGRFALHINDDMNSVTIVRTSTFTNVLQFCRRAA